MPSVKIKGFGCFKISKGACLLDLLIKKNISINAACNGQGRCGLCRIRISGKRKPLSKIERILIPLSLSKIGYRLACRYRVTNSVSVTIPEIGITKTDVSSKLGLALDIGTTVIKAAIVDLKKSKVINKIKVYNPQNSLGGDVITRISAALDGKYKLLRNHLLSGISDIKKKAGVAKPIYTTIVGNPVMLSFYLNKRVDGLARYPFKAEIKKDIFLKNPARYVFPIIGGFVGGDTIAGIMASKCLDHKGASLYVDLGTNGEVALICKNKIIALSTAAGPAFEGIGISHGSLAIPGAIDHVDYKDGFKIHTIGNRKPIGICASGLIELLDILIELGWLQQNGRLLKGFKLQGFKITQDDIRKLQLAIGAIHTGIQMLLEKFGIKPIDIAEVILTGEFGSRLKLKSLISLGILPMGIKRLRFEKDLPLKGAIKVLLDHSALKEARRIEMISHYLELANQPEFQNKFVAALRLKPWN